MRSSEDKLKDQNLNEYTKFPHDPLYLGYVASTSVDGMGMDKWTKLWGLAHNMFPLRPDATRNSFFQNDFDFALRNAKGDMADY